MPIKSLSLFFVISVSILILNCAKKTNPVSTGPQAGAFSDSAYQVSLQNEALSPAMLSALDSASIPLPPLDSFNITKDSSGLHKTIAQAQNVATGNLLDIFIDMLDFAYSLTDQKCCPAVDYPVPKGGSPIYDPDQIGLAYSYGQKDYTRRLAPDDGDALHQLYYVYGLDCSGFIANVLKAGGIYNALDFQGFCTANAVDYINNALEQNFPKYYTTVYNSLVGSLLKDGDIILWQKSQGAPNCHIGIIYLVGDIPLVFQSNGDPDPLSNGTPKCDPECDQTNNFASPNRGVNVKSFNKMVAAVKYWGPNYEIIRLDSLGWHTTSPFNIARAGHTSVVNNGYIYVIGGSCTTQQWMNDVQYAPINPDGSLGSWQNTTPLNTPRNYHTSVVNNGYVYVIGGNANEGNGTGYDLNDVQYAKFNADGTVGAWQSTTPFNPPGRCEHTSVVYNGYLYVMQGFAGSAASPCPDMQYAPINADGSVGTWQSTSTFSPASWGLSSAVWNGRIYSMGGWNQDSNGNYYDLNDVQYSLINSDGSLGNWQQSASQLNPPLGSFGLVAFNSYLFITGGGIFPSEYLNSVKYVTINSDGGLGSWQNAPSFNNGRANHTSVVNNGYLYVLGGSNATTYFNDVQYLNITKNITIK